MTADPFVTDHAGPFLRVVANGAIVDHLWACNSDCLARMHASDGAPTHPVEAPAHHRHRCRACGATIGGQRRVREVV